jgi:8-oxo-dGTP diphosphatase
MRSAYGAEEIGIGGHLVTIVVDVANVMGSRPDGWWRDRAGAAARLHAEMVRLAASGRAIPPGTGPPAQAGAPGEAVTPSETVTPGFVLVLEGAAKAAPIPAAPIPAAPAPAVPIPAAPAPAAPAPAAPAPAAESGPADPVQPGEVRVVRARGSGDDAIVAVVRELPGRRVVVTADRELRDRSVAAGATVLRPGWLLGLLRD